jgi:DNA modification methylase
MAKQFARLDRRVSQKSSKKPVLATEVVRLSTQSLKPFPGNPRQHSDAQITLLSRNIQTVWTDPILVDENRTILSGHARLAAAKHLGLSEVPTLTLSGASEAQKRAILIAENRIAEKSTWDYQLLRGQLQEIIDCDFDVELSGYSTGEIDILLDAPAQTSEPDPLDELDAALLQATAVSRIGDLWKLGNHALLCADARDSRSYEALMGDRRAQQVISDPPFNVKIRGHARGRGKVDHREFVAASGELSAVQFQEFLASAMRHAIAFSSNGSIHCWFQDWRHLPEILNAALPRYSAWMQLLVWNKNNGGQGSFYRSKHELILVFKNGQGKHVNNFGLGATGRYRTNVLDYPGLSGTDPRKREEADLHPTMKPIALIADLIRDCSHRNAIVLDAFAGSGTMLLAAERTGRIARAMELDPLYVDVAIRRWEKATGRKARHASTGLTLEELKRHRSASASESRIPLPRRRHS